MMAALPIRLLHWRPFLLAGQNSSRTLCTAPPAGTPKAAVLPNKIDDAYLSPEKVDIESVFLSKTVQKLLRNLTAVDMNKVFAPKKNEISPPKYKLLTEEQFKREMEKAKRRSEQMTQMPPVLRKRKPCERVLRKDPELQGALFNNFIFTDISVGHDELARPIVVRQPDGVLRTASWEERERMMQIYFTDPAREFDVPTMFKEPHLTETLNRGRYIFVLDRACVQFEPNSEAYLGVTQRVYEHLMGTGKFDLLRSTRHFGPMCFYYAVSKQCDALMLEMLQTGRLESAVDLVKLLHELHPDSSSLKEIKPNSRPEQYVEAYIKWESQKKAQLELALQSCKEAKEDQQKKAEVTKNSASSQTETATEAER